MEFLWNLILKASLELKRNLFTYKKLSEDVVLVLIVTDTMPHTHRFFFPIFLSHYFLFHWSITFCDKRYQKKYQLTHLRKSLKVLFLTLFIYLYYHHQFFRKMKEKRQENKYGVSFKTYSIYFTDLFITIIFCIFIFL